jgi:type IX secretion system PorP/SprF family membrane protein
MKTKIYILLLSGFFFFVTGNIFAQKEYSFASTGQQKLILNPSFAGSSKGLNVQTVYANSFALYSPIIQYYTGVDYGFKNGFGMGLSFTKHNYGDKLYVSNQVDLTGSYQIRLKNKITIVPSLQASYLQIALDRTKLNFGDYLPYSKTQLPSGVVPQWDVPVVLSTTKKNVTFSTGFILDYNHKITFGVSFFDINQPDVGLMGVNKKYLTQIYHVAGILFNDKIVSLQPYSLLKLQHYNEQFLEGGFYTNYKMLILQTACRTQFNYSTAGLHNTFFSVIAGAALSYRKCKFGYTFKSLNTSFKYSAHEIFFAARLGNNDKKIDMALFVD